MAFSPPPRLTLSARNVSGPANVRRGRSAAEGRGAQAGLPHGVGNTRTRVNLQGEGGSLGTLKASFWGCGGRRGRRSRYLACSQVGYGHGSPRACVDRPTAISRRVEALFVLSRQTSGRGGRGGQIGSRGGGRAISRTGDRTTRPGGSVRDWHKAVTASSRLRTHTISKKRCFCMPS